MGLAESPGKGVGLAGSPGQGEAPLKAQMNEWASVEAQGKGGPRLKPKGKSGPRLKPKSSTSSKRTYHIPTSLFSLSSDARSQMALRVAAIWSTRHGKVSILLPDQCGISMSTMAAAAIMLYFKVVVELCKYGAFMLYFKSFCFADSNLFYHIYAQMQTSLVRAVVQECGAHLNIISPHSVHGAHAGESERILREAFAEASSHAALGKPSVIFIDEIDALCPRRDSKKEQDIRVASRLFTLMDSNKPLLCQELYFSDDILETRKFEVYLDFFQSSWKKTEDLGDRMLFLGKCYSMSFSAKELGVGMSNTIYFSNDPVAPWWNEWDSYHLRGISTSWLTYG
ncbi:hypothetical protein L6164_026833 [Bauhinia variegata]|uniref:Uncharacterized protein n=1 Tax=Bauhinia variegata TaxID=167791 RepID=A0ACB9LSB9_BAUVA|nr:hypothetical protein L6164_026833 [Bauhinia variegata]